MNVIKSFFRNFVKAPVLVQREDKPPYASFNKHQFWLYPEQCVAQFNEAMSYCPAENQRKWRQVMAIYFGSAFAV